MKASWSRSRATFLSTSDSFLLTVSFKSFSALWWSPHSDCWAKLNICYFIFPLYINSSDPFIMFYWSPLNSVHFGHVPVCWMLKAEYNLSALGAAWLERAIASCSTSGTGRKGPVAVGAVNCRSPAQFLQTRQMPSSSWAGQCSPPKRSPLFSCGRFPWAELNCLSHCCCRWFSPEPVPAPGLSPVPLLAPAREAARGEDLLAFNSSHSLPLQQPQSGCGDKVPPAFCPCHNSWPAWIGIYDLSLQSLLQFHCFMSFPLSLCISGAFFPPSTFPLQYSFGGNWFLFHSRMQSLQVCWSSFTLPAFCCLQQLSLEDLKGTNRNK